MTHFLLNIDAGAIDWARAQFAITAIYHWLFVPLTFGLAMIMGMLLPYTQALLEGYCPLLAEAFWNKFRHGRCNGNNPRV